MVDRSCERAESLDGCVPYLGDWPRGEKRDGSHPASPCRPDRKQADMGARYLALMDDCLPGPKDAWKAGWMEGSRVGWTASLKGEWTALLRDGCASGCARPKVLIAILP